jgi:WD40 repeat protein
LECAYITCTSPNSRYYYYDVSNDGDHLLVFNATTIEMLDLIEFTSLFFMSGFTVLTRVCFSGDCSHVICSETKLGVMGVFSAVNGEKVSSFETEVGARDVVCSLNGVYCGTHRYYDGISIWDIRTGDMTHRFRHEADWFCFGKDGEYVVAIHGFALLMKTWDLASGDILFSCNSSMLAAGLPTLQFSVSSSAVVLRGSGNFITRWKSIHCRVKKLDVAMVSVM